MQAPAAKLHRNARPLLILAMLSLAAPTRALAVIRYESTMLTQIAGQSHHMYVPSFCIADLNRDGILDVTATGFYSGLHVLLGRGDGTLEPPAIVPIPTLFSAVADFDGDGAPDIAGSNYAGGNDGAAGVVFGDGSGRNWSAPVLFSGPYITIAVGDFDEDGRTDFVSTSSHGSNGSITAFLSRPGRTFAPVTSTTDSVMQYPNSILVGDYNQDGHADVMINGYFGRIDEFLGHGNGTFTRRTVRHPSGTSYGMDIADMSGDGIPDIVQSRDHSIGTYPGLGDGTFGALDIYLDSTSVRGIVLDDVTRDGLPDQVYSRIFSIAVEAGLPGGGLGPRSTFPANHRLYPLRLADMNGDEDLDLVTMADDERGLLVMLGHGNGTFGGTTSRIVLENSAPYLTVGDLDQDSLPDVVVGVRGYVEVWRGIPGRQFVRTAKIPAGESGGEVFVVDLDRDGLRDVLGVVIGGVGGGPNQLKYFRGNGDGALAPGIATGISGMQTAAFGDFNGDSLIDAVVPAGNSLRFHPGLPNQTFGPGIDTPMGYPVSTLKIGELNGDGILDVALTFVQSYPDPWIYGMRRAYGAGNGTFIPSAPVFLNDYVEGVSVADLNGDGRDDIVTGVTGEDVPGRIVVLLQQPNGTMSASIETSWPSRMYPPSVLVDVTGDGICDGIYRAEAGFGVAPGDGAGRFATEGGYEGTVGGAFIAADFDRDGRLDVAQSSRIEYPDQWVVALFYGRESVPPSVSLHAPDGTAPIPLGFPISIQWQAGDDAGVHSIDLFVSRHGPNGPFSAIARDLPNTGAWEWMVTGPVCDSAMVKVVARDMSGNVATVTTPQFSIQDVTGVAPLAIPPLALGRVAPNPSRSRLSVDFAIRQAGPVRIDVVDISGRRVATLLDESRTAGAGAIQWTIPGRVPAGLYFLQLRSGGNTRVERFAIVR